MKRSRWRIVFDTIKLIVWIAIAVALVKFAFFPGGDTTAELNPQGNFDLPSVAVERGDIDNEIRLDAAVVRDESVPVKATHEGEIVWLYVVDGAEVSAGEKILQVKYRQTVESANPEEPPTERDLFFDVITDAAGTLKLEALVGQQVSIGDPVGTIVPATFHAQVAVTPDQLYSLSGLPQQGTIAIKDGPAPFPCHNLQVVAESSSSSGEDPGGSSGPQVRCEIPLDQTVFDGVKGTLEIEGGSAKDVLVVPATAVEGRYGSGLVYLPTDDPLAKPTEVKVGLGLSNGEYIEITEGLGEGQEILEFVPTPMNRYEEEKFGEEMMY
ncbi:MAG: efflux RND transporter periplasmic adaptor subunit [Flaviflexus sp.]|nr:efflux RND transporter periplasmic adaptor subunit [Flaviflexus sp.]